VVWGGSHAHTASETTALSCARIDLRLHVLQMAPLTCPRTATVQLSASYRIRTWQARNDNHVVCRQPLTCSAAAAGGYRPAHWLRPRAV
jgi:hypothetical protein